MKYKLLHKLKTQKDDFSLKIYYSLKLLLSDTKDIKDYTDGSKKCVFVAQIDKTRNRLVFLPYFKKDFVSNNILLRPFKKL